jgi:hypothetical protein
MQFLPSTSERTIAYYSLTRDGPGTYPTRFPPLGKDALVDQMIDFLNFIRKLLGPTGECLFTPEQMLRVPVQWIRSLDSSVDSKTTMIV